ncbi:MAG TPA: hypothetical protein VFQ89_06925, partial [Candidatus Binatia bacterium]|nr:hypothetical protein [Candidatus Binatia bacterium]
SEYEAQDMQSNFYPLAIVILASLTGCASVGPGNVARDRFDYISAISDSWKAQMLLNLVKLRYGDAPVFLDVASVITQTGVQGTFGVAGNWWQNPFFSSSGVSALGTYGEKPTVTYLPMSGEKFARSLMTPIPPGAILSFLQAGYPSDIVLRLAVHTINGIHNRNGYGPRARQADPEFFPLIEKLRDLQQSGQIGLRVKRIGTQTATAMVFSRRLTPEIAAARDEVRKLLGLNPELDEIDVVYGSVAANDKEIALLTRSVLEILTDISSYIDVPAASVEQERTFPSPAPEVVNGAAMPTLMRIASSSQKPDDAFAAVPYGPDWYWIDDKDFASKRLFSFIMFLFTLTDSGDKQGAPIVTIPAG